MAIPSKIKKKLEKLDRMKSCEYCSAVYTKIDWHHCLSYGKNNSRIQEDYAIRALCNECHMGNSMKPIKRADLVCRRNAIQEGLKDLQKNYPKNDWLQELRRINYELNIIN